MGLLKKKRQERNDENYISETQWPERYRERAEKHGRRMKKKKMSELNNFLRRTDGSLVKE